MVESQPGTVQSFDPAVSLNSFSASTRDHFIFNENQLVLAKVQQTEPVFAHAVNRSTSNIFTTFDEYKNLSGTFVYIDGSFQSLATPGVPTSDVHRIVIGFDQQIATDTVVFYSVNFVDTALVFMEYSFDNNTWFSVGAITWQQEFDDTIQINPDDEPPTGEFKYTGTFDGGSITARYWRIRSDAQAEWLSGTGATITVDSTDNFPTTNATVHVFNASGGLSGTFGHTGKNATQFTGKTGTSTFGPEYQIVNLQDPFGNTVTEVQIIPTLSPILEHWNSDGTQAVTNAMEGTGYYHLAYDKNDDVYFAIRFDHELEGAAPDPSDNFNALTGADFSDVLWTESTVNTYFIHSDANGTLDYKTATGPGQLEHNVGVDGNFKSTIDLGITRLSSLDAFFALESKDFSTNNQYLAAAITGPYGTLEDVPLDPGKAYIAARSVGPLIWSETTSLVATDVSANQEFGHSVDISGNVIVVGVPKDDTNGALAGAVFVYDQVKGVSKVVASDGVAGDEFGQSVAVDGDVLVVGAWKHNNGVGAESGAAYVFERNGVTGVWEEQEKLAPSAGVADDLFGVSVDVSGDYIVVGSYQDDSGGFNAGAAFVYEKSGTWPATETIKLVASDAAAGDKLGASVAIDGNTLVAGTPFGDDEGQNSGTAYVFERSGTWAEDRQLLPGDGEPDGEFGSSVAISGDIIVVGAPPSAGGTAWSISNVGSAYVFDRDEGGAGLWGLKEKLHPYTVYDEYPSAADTKFGVSVGVSGDRIVIGASGDKAPVIDAEGVAQDFVTGAAYMFEYDSITDKYRALKKLEGFQLDGLSEAGMASAGSLFGESVAIDTTQVVCGAKLATVPVGDVGGLDDHTAAGSVFVFGRSESISIWAQQTTLTPSDDDGGAIENFGDAISVSGDVVAIGASGKLVSGDRFGQVYTYDGAFAEKIVPVPADVVEFDLFGHSVSLDGAATTLVVGCPNRDGTFNASGAAYVFELQGGAWVEVAKLQAATHIANARFGEKVQISGNYIAVTSFAGNVYIFEKGGGSWPTEETQLLAGLGIRGVLSGTAFVADRSPVGVEVYDRNGTTGVWEHTEDVIPASYLGNVESQTNIGFVGNLLTLYLSHSNGLFGLDRVEEAATYVFERSGSFVEVASLPDVVISNVSAGDRLISRSSPTAGAVIPGSAGINYTGIISVYDKGTTWPTEPSFIIFSSLWQAASNSLFALAVDDDVMAINVDADAVMVFDRTSSTGWQDDRQVLAGGISKEDEYGVSADVSGDSFVVGAHKDDDEGTDAGAIYIFDSLTTSSKRVASEVAAGPGDLFGGAVALDTDTVVAGAPGYDSSRGIAYIFDRALGGLNAWGQRTAISGTGIAAGDEFGASVDIDVDTVIVGSPKLGTDAGTAHVFERDNGGANVWDETIEITEATPSPGDLFGFSLAVNGDLAVVGAPGTASSSGIVHVFGRDEGASDNWGLIKSISTSDSTTGEEFGYSVDIDGDTIVAGARGQAGVGAAYVFEKDSGGVDNWGEVQKIISSSPVAGDEFGSAVTIEGDIIAVGSRFDDDAGSNAGTTYIFEKSGTWPSTEDAKLNASDASTSAEFGAWVALGSGKLLVGAYLHDGSAVDEGAAYLYERSQTIDWDETDALLASDTTPALGNVFGASVSTQGGRSAIGAYKDGDNGSEAGAVYMFTGATEDEKLLKPDGSEEDRFGYDVSLSGDTAAIGIPGDTDDSGGVSIFEYSGSWTQTLVVSGTDTVDNDVFGQSVGLDIDTLLVGAPGKLSDLGAAYVFYRDDGGADNWGEVFKLAVSGTLGLGDDFGYSVAVSGDVAVVGAPGDASNTGTAYVFERDENGSDQWGNVAQISASVPAAGSRFGHSVSVSGTRIAIGAPDFDATAADGAGTVYVFEKSGTWPTTETQRVSALDFQERDGFGYSVSISDDRLAVGGYQNDDTGNNSGSAYVFEYSATSSSWEQVEKVLASDAAAGDEFGYSVSIDSPNDSLLIGTFIFPTFEERSSFVGASMVYSGDLSLGTSAELQGFRIKPEGFDFSVATTTITLTYVLANDNYSVLIDGVSYTDATPGVAYENDIVTFTLSNLTTPSDGQSFIIDVTAAVTTATDNTTVSGVQLEIERIGTNGYARYKEATDAGLTTLFVGNISASYRHRAQLYADADEVSVDVSADNYVASGDTLIFDTPVFSLVTVDKSGNLVQVPSVSDADGYAIKRFDVIQNINKVYNNYLTPVVGVATNGADVGSGGELYIKVGETLYRYLKSAFPLDLEDGSSAAVTSTEEIPNVGITAFSYNGYSQAGLSYIEYVPDLSGVFVKTIETTNMTATTNKAKLDVASISHPFAWNVSDLSTLYFVDNTTDLKLYDLNETKAAFVNVTSDKQVLAAGTQETATITAQVLNVYGEPKSNKTMTFSVSAGDGAISPAIGCSDGNGEDDTTYTVGSAVGTATVTVTVSDLTC